MIARPQAARMTRDERVADILQAARDVFCEKGYEPTAVSEIAARIGVVEGTIYKYFASKRELLLKVLEHWYEEMFGDYARDLAAIKGARARLHLLIWRHLRSVRDYPLLCRLMFREVHGESDYHGSGLHAMNRQYTQFLIDVIEEGRASGEFRTDLPTALLRDMVYGATEHHSWPYLRKSAAVRAERGAASGHVTLDIDVLAEQITSILCDGISRRDAPASPLETPFRKRATRNRSSA
ncbi:TetR/AcrR family transcriptional regulator [Solimonas terrae]|uniref:TetR/AcrR family transcriptional regulator n=1 Tax=Solimonas terrae TaxID=1396819 RepID=A0A6M2BVR9_9GAMM|nr:TetR/AcrR family transcriptional regulator [Solimonas terrae]NGY06355.1 TetR/AcrR family transcriptional regulator [Solimonas terrae]